MPAARTGVGDGDRRGAGGALTAHLQVAEAPRRVPEAVPEREPRGHVERVVEPVADPLALAVLHLARKPGEVRVGGEVGR